MIWSKMVRKRADKFRFLTEGIDLSAEILRTYEDLKERVGIVSNLLYDMDKNSIRIMKEYLIFYIKAEEILDKLLNEILREEFLNDADSKMCIFEVIDKILKLFLCMDNLKMKNMKIFDIYSMKRLVSFDEFTAQITDAEDDRISIIGMMTMPMGRLFLSMFRSTKFDLHVPALLSRRCKINLNREQQGLIAFYAYVCEKYAWKYLGVYLHAGFKKLKNIELYEYPRFKGYVQALNEQM